MTRCLQEKRTIFSTQSQNGSKLLDPVSFSIPKISRSVKLFAVILAFVFPNIFTTYWNFSVFQKYETICAKNTLFVFPRWVCLSSYPVVVRLIILSADQTWRFHHKPSFQLLTSGDFYTTHNSTMTNHKWQFLHTIPNHISFYRTSTPCHNTQSYNLLHLLTIDNFFPFQQTTDNPPFRSPLSSRQICKYETTQKI